MRRLLCGLIALSTITLVQANKPLGLADILSWKRIQSASVSNDGNWFAYQLVPTEGDATVVIRDLTGGKDSTFPIGELPAATGGFGPPAPFATAVRFSEDSKWAAFTVYPNKPKTPLRDRKPTFNKMVLVELATGKKTEFDRVRRYSFSGERGGWLAMLRYKPEGQKWEGADLILRELATGDELNTGNVAEFAFDKKGDWLAFIADASDMAGNGVQLRNMETGAVMPLDSAKAAYKGLTWTEKGDGLAVLRGVEDKAFEEKLYAVVGFRNLSATARPEKIQFDPKAERGFPAGMTVSPNRPPSWTQDLAAITFGIHEVKAKKPGEEPKGPPAPPAVAPAKPDEKERAGLVLWHWQDKRLQPQQQVEESRDKSFSYLSLYRVAEKRFVRLADDTLRQVNIPEPHTMALGVDQTPYQLNGSLNGQRFQDVYVVDLATGKRTLALQKARYFNGPSPDSKFLAYYEDGHHWVYDTATGAKKNLTANVKATTFWDDEDDHNVLKPPARSLGWSADSRALLVTDNWDIWKVGLDGKATNLTLTGKKEKVRYRSRYRLDPEEKGVDLSKTLYVDAYGEWTKKGGIVSIAPGAKPKTLVWDDARFGGLLKAKNADKFLYRRESWADYPDYHAAGAELGGAVRITAANPQQKEFGWTSGARLIDYTSEKGDKLQGALYLPANYEPGKRYPTVVYIYERLSDGLNSYAQPSLAAFNRSVYNNQGYAVFTPDITYKLNDPGMSAVWCVLPGLKAAVASGVVDEARVGLHGHSWGGYQTAFLVTQTNAFKSAIAGAPLTDMISMYSSVYWNTGSANQPIFESSQGRFTSGYTDNLEAYVRNSPVFHAQKVQTPLMILHNDKDGAVDFTQGIEYFNTLRRLQKPVIMLQYRGENHGLRVPVNQKDYLVRMREYFGHHLKGDPAPAWLTEGVPHLKLKDHLDEREPLTAPKAATKPPAESSAGSSNP
ncbi:MAG: S9 family peptidase [Bryobacterales bacterium]|nr:S9 family peptidase [Bryobacterales bacterium]